MNKKKPLDLLAINPRKEHNHLTPLLKTLKALGLASTPPTPQPRAQDGRYSGQTQTPQTWYWKPNVSNAMDVDATKTKPVHNNCYRCLKLEHFACDCRAPRSQQVHNMDLPILQAYLTTLEETKDFPGGSV